MRQEIANVDEMVVEDLFRIFQQAKDRRIAHLIEDVLPLFAALNDVALPQDGELLGELTLFYFQPGAEVVDSDFATAQDTQNLDPEWMSEGFEEFSGEIG